MTATNWTDAIPAIAASMIPKVPVTLDTKGRERMSKEQRRVILDEFERSGESAAGFAKRTGLKYSTLAGWLVRYRRAKPVRRVPPLRLLEAVVDPAHSALSAAQIENKLLRQKLELFLKRYFGGTKNEGLDPKQRELLLAGLEAMIAPGTRGGEVSPPTFNRHCQSRTPALARASDHRTRGAGTGGSAATA